MSAVQRTSSDAIINWEPSEGQKRHGWQAYASRVLKEGVVFEKAGDVDQARLRYAKCRAYCIMRGIAYPPFSDRHSALVKAVGEGESTETWTQGEKLPLHPNSPKRGRPAKAKRKAWSGDREAAKLTGQRAYLAKLIKNGQMSEAREFAARHGIALFTSVGSGARAILESLSPPVETDAEESLSGVGKLGGDAVAGNVVPQRVVEPPAPEPPSLPNGSPDPATLSLREQLIRQLAEIDAGERKQEADARKLEDERPIEVRRPQPMAKEVWDASQQTYADVEAYAETLAKEVPAGVLLPESQEPVKPQGNAPQRPSRRAIIWRFPRNPRLAVIRFPDGDKPLERCEDASLFLDPRRPLVRNQGVVVRLAQGESFIWELVPQP